MKSVEIHYRCVVTLFIFVNFLNVFFLSALFADSVLSPIKKTLIINQAIKKIVLLQTSEGCWRPKNIHYNESETTYQILQMLTEYNSAYKLKPLYLKGVFWFSKNQTQNCEFLARKIKILRDMNMNYRPALTQLISYQNSDGGWGMKMNNFSNIYNTSIVLKTFLDIGLYKSASVEKGISFLKNNQNANGSYSLCQDMKSSPFYTSLAMIALNHYNKQILEDNPELNHSIQEASKWLFSIIDPTTFNSQKSLIEMCFALQALYAVQYEIDFVFYKEQLYQTLNTLDVENNIVEAVSILRTILMIENSLNNNIQKEKNVRKKEQSKILQNSNDTKDLNQRKENTKVPFSSVADATPNTPTSEPPVADIEKSAITEGHWPIRIDAGESSDDIGIEKYEWDFGDNQTGTGYSNKHIYWKLGDYTVTCTVYDAEMQYDSDTMIVHVVRAGAPVADAGGPYEAAEGGPPAYFNAENSFDDFGIVKFFWDVDDKVDSDGDGNFINDIDLSGKTPFYVYNKTGQYTVTLRTVDGAGQSTTVTTHVEVLNNLPPDVICVPWQSVDPQRPHEIVNHQKTKLKAIVRDKGELKYQWDFGDGSAPYPAIPEVVTNKYAIEATHQYPESFPGTPFIATLKVWDEKGLTGSDNYYLQVFDDDIKILNHIALDEGLWWLHKNQDKSGWWWKYGSYKSSPTASALQAFVINGHTQDGDNTDNPYIETVYNGLNFVFTTLKSEHTSIQHTDYKENEYDSKIHDCDPDSNHNTIGITVNESNPIYQGGMVMDLIASTNTPLCVAMTGENTNIKGQFYYYILTDMADMYAYGQSDNGGWRYNWHYSSDDNSANQWAAIGLIVAEINFGIKVPEWVKYYNYKWLESTYDQKKPGFGYTGIDYTNSDSDMATTPSGFIQLILCDNTINNTMWIHAQKRLLNNWKKWYCDQENYYALYALVKAFKLAKPEPVIYLREGDQKFDWYNSEDETQLGVRKHIIDKQIKDANNWGAWSGGGRPSACPEFHTSWATIMLTPNLFSQSPVAIAGDNIIWGYDVELKFDASRSFHMDKNKKIVLYEWDFDGDGNWDLSTSNPSDPNAVFTYPDPNPNADDYSMTYLAKLRVTDNSDPPLTDTDVRRIVVVEPPHTPFAVPGGPYFAKINEPVELDASKSYDIDLTDSISLYQWDLDLEFGKWFEVIEIETTEPKVSYIYTRPGVYNIALKVRDRGAFNPVGCVIGKDCQPLESLPAFTTVHVYGDMPLFANAGGPYSIAEGLPLQLDGSKSTSNSSTFVHFEWDFDLDGMYDATGMTPVYTWIKNGVYRIKLRVSDNFNHDINQGVVRVNDMSPTASFEMASERQRAKAPISFIDKSTSPVDKIVAWSWDFGGKGASNDQNPSFTFNQEGEFNVTLTVTDEDGSTSSFQKIIHVDNQNACDDCEGGIMNKNCFIQTVIH